MDIKELRTTPRAGLIKHLATLREQIRDLRFKIHSKEIKNNHRLSEVKREIAQILTLLNQEEVK